ncbi:hypothetical protein BJ165DRAFT_1546604 [Panaeolus papilionaceus]|nr:hypothetical protein BJ165DRAFT_1546604 [Panaeolus papilionaceus]
MTRKTTPEWRDHSGTQQADARKTAQKRIQTISPIWVPTEEGGYYTLQPRLAATHATNVADSEPKVPLSSNPHQSATDTILNSNPVLPSLLSHYPSVTSKGSASTAIQGLRKTFRFSYVSYPDEPALSDTVSQILGNLSRQASINEGSSSRPSPVSEVPPLPAFSGLGLNAAFHEG